MQMGDWLALRQAVNEAASELDPPPQHWLESECSISYCAKCAEKERGKEFELGPLIRASDWWRRSDWEDAFWEGVSSYPYRCAGEGDSTAACYICGVTLDYWLTDYGIKEEIDYWQGAEMSGDLAEIAYNLDRLFECSDEDKPAVEALAIRFLKHAAASKGE